MALDVYSSRFLAEHGLSGSAVYTAGPGFLLVIRQLDFWINVGAGPSATSYMYGSAGQTIWWNSTGPLSVGTDHWSGRQIINPGESFGVYSDGPADITVSGYVLKLP
jgi:hypothetical protein